MTSTKLNYQCSQLWMTVGKQLDSELPERAGTTTCPVGTKTAIAIADSKLIADFFEQPILECGFHTWRLLRYAF